MLVGLDLDNTIIDYDTAFAQAARLAGWVRADFAGSKRDLRTLLWAQPDGDRIWRGLQARVYGPEISGAALAKGYHDFATRAADAGAELVIISHKTAFAAAAPDGPDLRQCALEWMSDHGVTGSSPGQVRADRVIFADSRDAKISAIRSARCEVFVDDLTEVLLHPEFPARTTRLHFYPGASDGPPADPALVTCRSWRDVTQFTFGA